MSDMFPQPLTKIIVGCQVTMVILVVLTIGIGIGYILAQL